MDSQTGKANTSAVKSEKPPASFSRELSVLSRLGRLRQAVIKIRAWGSQKSVATETGTLCLEHQVPGPAATLLLQATVYC